METALVSILNAFYAHRNGAKDRDIGFLLSFEDWLKIWQESGHLHERGCHRGQYVMARFEDKGPYAIDNVKIITHAENLNERSHEYKYTTISKRKMSESKKGKKQTLEHRQKGALFRLGKKRSEETKEKIGKAHRGKVLSFETKKKISESKKGKLFSIKHKQKLSIAKLRQYSTVNQMEI